MVQWAPITSAGSRRLRSRLKASGPVTRVSGPSVTHGGTAPPSQRPGSEPAERSITADCPSSSPAAPRDHTLEDPQVILYHPRGVEPLLGELPHGEAVERADPIDLGREIGEVVHVDPA